MCPVHSVTHVSFAHPAGFPAGKVAVTLPAVTQLAERFLFGDSPAARSSTFRRFTGSSLAIFSSTLIVMMAPLDRAASGDCQTLVGFVDRRAIEAPRTGFRLVAGNEQDGPPGVSRQIAGNI
ncbi:MAG: hypothetical protein F4087_11195 [Gemmatimonadetes bacterium]|nr:hypothetical protein [Gemmatimonadota bacterium]